MTAAGGEKPVAAFRRSRGIAVLVGLLLLAWLNVWPWLVAEVSVAESAISRWWADPMQAAFLLFSGALCIWFVLSRLSTRVLLYRDGFAVIKWGRVEEFPWSRVIEVRFKRPGSPAPFNLDHTVVRDDGYEFNFVETGWEELAEVIERRR